MRSYLLHMLLSFQYVMRDEVYTKWWHEKDVETYNTQARENGDNTSDMTRPHFFPRTFPARSRKILVKKYTNKKKIVDTTWWNDKLHLNDISDYFGSVKPQCCIFLILSFLFTLAPTKKEHHYKLGLGIRHW